MRANLRVVLDATAVPPDRGGVGRYVDALAPALVRAGVDLVVACRPGDEGVFEESGARVRRAPAATDRRLVRFAWEQAGLPRLVRRADATVLHSPHYTMPWFAGVPVVVTLHDATFFTDPHLHQSVKARFFRAATRVASRRAASLVVPSAATRDEVLREVGAVGTERFHVAYHGVDTAMFHPATQDEVESAKRSVGLDGRRAVVFLGTLEPRKNVGSLVEGWVRAVGDMPDPPALVLAGAKGWDEGIDRAIARVPSHLRLVRPGYVPVEALRGLLSAAEVVAYPSLGEGFGLPVLEAMACGAPVLTTRRLAIPEVGGDAVAYTEPDPDSIATALATLLADPGRRAALGAAAHVRAASFTWDAAARVHVAAYEQALRASRDDG